MNSLGFDQISIEPVVADPKQPYALTYEDLPEVFEEYDRLSKIMIEKQKSGKGFNFYHFMIDLDQGPCAIKRLRGCGCGNEYVAITPDGDVYPCHQFVGHEEWKMGNVFDLSINKEMKDNFARATVYHKPKCQDCWPSSTAAAAATPTTGSIWAMCWIPSISPVRWRRSVWNAPL